MSRQLVSQTIRKVHKDKTYWRRQRDLDLTQKEEYTRCVNRCSLCQRDLFGNFLFSDFLFSWWLGLERGTTGVKEQESLGGNGATCSEDTLKK